MTLTCLIVDDQPSSIASLSRLLEKTPGVELVGTETNALTALSLVRSGAIKVDILFLDINMPDIDGVEFAHLISGLAFVVFITAYLDRAIDAFDVGAVDYLLKPVKPAALQRAVQRAADRIGKTVETVADLDAVLIRGNEGKLHSVKPEHIILISAREKYCNLYLQNEAKPRFVNLSIGDIEAILPGSLLMRIHKSYIIGFRHIATVIGNVVTLNNGKEVRIGPTYMEAFNAKIVGKIARRFKGNDQLGST
ncbi:LytTR family DNA-binding domain-containing protein [Niabella sp. W65]|nr:LytTR family DNA-binding domain-containing protein [Niabella sp. W65]MCH7362816.1 LytTR family DNA-binding domain-containing protein [Niabella sp. W65]ULT38772.1 LytTR family DNA-binding domain-containing protein [Niabella sp. I65]